MNHWVRRNIIVTAGNAPLARALSAQVVGLSGTGMFTTGLAPTTAGPATHFVSSGWLWESYAALMTDADAMFAACQQAGAAVTLAQCQALVTESDVSDAEVEDIVKSAEGYRRLKNWYAREFENSTV